jgi:hypothetical protein
MGNEIDGVRGSSAKPLQVENDGSRAIMTKRTKEEVVQDRNQRNFIEKEESRQEKFKNDRNELSNVKGVDEDLVAKNLEILGKLAEVDENQEEVHEKPSLKKEESIKLSENNEFEPPQEIQPRKLSRSPSVIEFDPISGETRPPQEQQVQDHNGKLNDALEEFVKSLSPPDNDIQRNNTVSSGKRAILKDILSDPEKSKSLIAFSKADFTHENFLYLQEMNIAMNALKNNIPPEPPLKDKDGNDIQFQPNLNPQEMRDFLKIAIYDKFIPDESKFSVNISNSRKNIVELFGKQDFNAEDLVNLVTKLNDSTHQIINLIIAQPLDRFLTKRKESEGKISGLIEKLPLEVQINTLNEIIDRARTVKDSDLPEEMIIEKAKEMLGKLTELNNSFDSMITLLGPPIGDEINENVKTILNNPEMTKAFLAFSKSDGSSQNPLFLLEMKTVMNGLKNNKEPVPPLKDKDGNNIPFPQNLNDQKMRDYLRTAVYDKFISENSTLRISLPDGQKSEIETFLNKKDFNANDLNGLITALNSSVLEIQTRTDPELKFSKGMLNINQEINNALHGLSLKEQFSTLVKIIDGNKQININQPDEMIVTAAKEFLREVTEKLKDSNNELNNAYDNLLSNLEQPKEITNSKSLIKEFIFNPQKAKYMDAHLRSEHIGEGIPFIKDLQTVMKALNNNIPPAPLLKNSEGIEIPFPVNGNPKQIQEYLKAVFLEKYIHMTDGYGVQGQQSFTLNISGLNRFPLEQLMNKPDFDDNDLKDLVNKFSTVSEEAMQLIIGDQELKFPLKVEKAENGILNELEDLSSKEKISRLTKIVNGTEVFIPEGTTRIITLAVAKSILEPLRAEDKISSKLSFKEPKIQFEELDKLINGTETIKGIDPNIVKQEAAKMKAALVEKYVNNNFSLSDSISMYDFVKTFVTGTSTIIGKSSNPDMRAIHNTLRELQALTKDDKPISDPDYFTEKLLVMNNLRDTCTNFINNQPNSSMTDQVKALLNKLNDNIPAIEESGKVFNKVFNIDDKNSQLTQNFNLTFADPIRLKHFDAYCQKEFTQENSQFLIHLQDALAKSPPNTEDLEKIFNDFIVLGGDNIKVNIPGNMLESITSAFVSGNLSDKISALGLAGFEIRANMLQPGAFHNFSNNSQAQEAMNKELEEARAIDEAIRRNL